MNHDLKSLPENFARLLSGSRKGELRVNDRNFGLGDHVTLREWKPLPRGRYTGRVLTVIISDVQEVPSARTPGARAVLLSYETVGAEAPARRATRKAPDVFHVGQIFEFQAPDPAEGGDQVEPLRIRVAAVDKKSGRPTRFVPV
jgi:hypothetical protein